MKKSVLKFKRTYFAMPYFVISAIFVVIPLLILFVWAFRDNDGGFTFTNFARLFVEAGTLAVLGRSFLIAFLTTLICFLLAYPIALILTYSKFNKNATLVLLFVMPMWINSLLRTYAIKTVFGILGMQNAYLNVVIAMVYDFFPFMLLPLYTILASMDKSYLEAAHDLGAGPISTFFRVKLPLSVPGIISGVLMVFMPTVSTFAISDIVAQTPDMYLLGNLIDSFFGRADTYNVGSAYAFVLLLIIAGTMVAANKLTGGKNQAKGGIL